MYPGSDSSVEECLSGPFAAEQSHGTKSPYWRANDALGHVKESHQI